MRRIAITIVALLALFTLIRAFAVSTGTDMTAENKKEQAIYEEAAKEL